MVKKKRDHDVAGGDTVLHISAKKSRPARRAPVDLREFLEPDTNIGTNRHDFVLPLCINAETLYDQLDTIQKFKRSAREKDLNAWYDDAEDMKYIHDSELALLMYMSARLDLTSPLRRALVALMEFVWNGARKGTVTKTASFVTAELLAKTATPFTTVLTALLEMKPTREVLLQNDELSVAAFTKLGTLISSSLKSWPCLSAMGESTTQRALVEDIEQKMTQYYRPLILLIQLSNSSLSFVNILANKQRDPKTLLRSITASILSTSLRVCHSAFLLSSNLVTQAAIVFAHLLYSASCSISLTEESVTASQILANHVFDDSAIAGQTALFSLWENVYVSCVELKRMEPIAKLAVCRGIMAAFPFLLWHPLGVVKRIIFDNVCCVDIPSRSYTFHTMDYYVSLLETELKSSPSSENCLVQVAQKDVEDILDLVLENWEHPAKRVTALMPSLFEKALSLQHLLVLRKSSTTEKEQSTFQHLLPLLSQVVRLPIERKAKYLALQSFLPHTGGQAIYDHYPSVVTDLLKVVATGANISNLAVSFLAPFLFSLRDNMLKAAGVLEKLPSARHQKRKKRGQYHCSSANETLKPVCGGAVETCLVRWRQFWAAPIATALCSGSHRSRRRIAMFVLPELLKMDHLDGAMALYRSVLVATSRLDLSVAEEDRLWATMEIINAARRLGIARGSSVREDDCNTSVGASTIRGNISKQGHVVLNEFMVTLPRSYIAMAMKSSTKRLYLSAMELVCASRETKMPLTLEEISLVKEYLPVLIKTGDSEVRTVLKIMVKTCMLRMMEALHVAKHNLEYRRRTKMKWEGDADTEKIDHEDQAAKRLLTDANCAARSSFEIALKDWQELRHTVIDVVTWFETFLLGCLYPGAPFERVGIALELLILLFRVFEKSHDDLDVECSLPKLMKSPETVIILLNTVIISWDQARKLSYELLNSLKAPWAGYERPEDLDELMEWAILLSGSPRTRESDAGALILRLVYSKFAVELNWRVSIPGVHASTNKQRADFHFFEDIVSSLETRILTTVPSLTAFHADTILSDVTNIDGATPPISGRKSGPPLPHGLFQALRYIVVDTSFRQKDTIWRSMCEKLVSIALQASTLALTVVGEDTANLVSEKIAVDDNAVVTLQIPRNGNDIVESIYKSTERIGDDVYAARGPINPNCVRFAPPKVDCRGHVILEDESMVDGQAEQIIVVGSWLIVKESSLFLAEAVAQWPLEHPLTSLSQGKEDKGAYLLSFDSVKRIGNHLLTSLLTLKHMGAIASAGQAMYILCQRLYKVTMKNVCGVEYRALPKEWLDNLLGRVDGEKQEQQFFLRRSTGFASAFLSILRADSSRSRPERLSYALNRLFQSASENKNWRQRVHALNVLKMVFEDALMAAELQSFAATAIEMAIDGFRSSSWAVRNSSMMLFAATFRLTVGNKTDKDDFSRRNRTTAPQFFGRFPTLFKHFYEQLLDASQWKEDAKEMHPTLFPVLLTLARLDPSASGRSEGRALVHDLSMFVPLLRACSSQAHHKARVMAARALSAIIPPTQAIGEIKLLIKELVVATNDEKFVRHNTVHGILLSLYHIIRNGQSVRWHEDGSLHQQVEFLLWDFVSAFVPWLLANTLCHPLHFLLLSIIEVLSKQSYQKEDPFMHLSFDYATELLESNFLKISKPIDLGTAQLLKLATSIVVRLGNTSNITSLVVHELPEVRLACLKAAKRRINRKAGFAYSVNVLDLQSIVDVLLFHISSDSSPFVLHYQLRLLILCGLPAYNNKTRANLETLWSVLMSVLKSSLAKSPRVCGEALELAGELYSLRSQYEDVTEVRQWHEKLVVLLEQTTKSSQDIHIRYGAVGTLMHMKSAFTFVHWRFALRLLQDDDRDVRLRSEEVFSNLIGACTLSGVTLLRQVYDYLLYEYGKDMVYVMQLVDIIDNVASTLENAIQSAQQGTRMITSLSVLFDRPIFETEDINLHMEPICEVQLACVALAKLSASEDTSEEIKLFLTKNAALFECRIREFEKLTSTDKDQWLGGISFDGGVFAALASNMLGAQACGVHVEKLIMRKQLKTIYERVRACVCV